MKSALFTTPYPEQIMTDAATLIAKAHAITLLTHYKPDADGMAACAALAHILEAHNKHTETIYPTQPDRPCKYQAPNVHINTHHQIPNLIISLDTATKERLYFPAAFSNIPLINIDHHVSNNLQATCHLINPAASSTCEELFVFLLHSFASTIDQYVAEALLLGMLYDSQMFRIQTTSARTLRVAAHLMDYGANLFQLKNELATITSPKVIAFWSKLLGNVVTAPSGKAAWVSITQADLKKHALTEAALAGFNNFLAEIYGVDIIIIFSEIAAGKTKVSLRSKVTNVNALAARFGGGGHINAAGILTDKPLEQMVKELTAGL